MPEWSNGYAWRAYDLKGSLGSNPSLSVNFAIHKCMVRTKKKNKLRQYVKVSRRRVKRANRKKILSWLKRNLEQHPFILALVILAWFNHIFTENIFKKANIGKTIVFHIVLIILWFIFVAISNLLKDKQKVKWYFRKRFVFFMLLLLPPLGLIFLWLGSQFQRKTKLVLSVVFITFFFAINAYYNKKNREMLGKSSFDRIAEVVSQPKKEIFLKKADNKVLEDIQLVRLRRRRKAKLAVSEIVSRYSRGLVSIKVKDANGKEIGMGSGFVVSQNGLIVTNFHVLESAYDAEVKIGDKIFREVYFVKGVPDLDIAIIKVNATELTPLPIGNSDTLIDGQFVVALGNPIGLERSVSSGIISALRSQGTLRFIQITAPVSPGSSGGPILNEYGEVIGITTLASLFMAQNINFAIPINHLNSFFVKEEGPRRHR